MKHRNTVLKYAVPTAMVLAAPMVANAQIDVSSAVSAITGDGSIAVTAIGSAIIGLAGLALVFKWVKGSIFG